MGATQTTTARADRRHVIALALALLSIPGSTVAWDLPLGGLWIGLPLGVAAILIARPVRRRTAAKIAIVIAGLAIAQMAAYSLAAVADAAPGNRDQVVALGVSVDWLTQYQPRSWVAVETPGPCIARPGGGRRCPIAIVIKARVGSTRVDHRCTAEAVLPRRGTETKPSRTSARCTPVASRATALPAAR